jgi:broad specificity phosphatase PhoE
MDSERLIGYLVRHGTTANNESRAFRGWVDVPLDAKGEKDAQEVGQWFQGKPLSYAISSDLQRAVKTNEAVLEPKGMTAGETPDLRSWNLGYLANQSKDDHKTEVAFYQDNPDTQVPRGESLNHFRQRVTPILKRAFLRGVENQHPSAIFTHSSVIHEAANLIHGDHTYVKVAPGGVVGVYHHPKTGFKLKALYKGISPNGERDTYGG